MPYPEHNNRVAPTSQLEPSTAPGVAIPPDSTARLKYVYLIAVGIWAAWCVLCPTWRGVSYHFDTFGQGGWIETGAFGITGSGSTPFHRRSFLWHRPTPSGGLIATYRWPFQPMTQDNVIEISIPWTLGRVWLGIISTGLAVGSLRRFLKAHEQSFVLGIAWCLSLTGLAFFVMSFVFGTLTLGRWLSPFFANLLAIVSIVMGVYCGIRQEFRRQRTEIEDPPNSQNHRKRNT